MSKVTLIELLVVVAIIGILAAVGATTFGGFQDKAKVSATKANYKNFSKWIQTEIIKCNTGMADKIFTANLVLSNYSSSNFFQWNEQCLYNKWSFL